MRRRLVVVLLATALLAVGVGLTDRRATRADGPSTIHGRLERTPRPRRHAGSDPARLGVSQSVSSSPSRVRRSPWTRRPRRRRCRPPPSPAPSDESAPIADAAVVDESPSPEPSSRSSSRRSPKPIAHQADGDREHLLRLPLARSTTSRRRSPTAWKASVHGQNGVGCADCHGGDPTSDQIGVAMDPAAGLHRQARPRRDGRRVRQLPLRCRRGCGSTSSRPTSTPSTTTSVHGQRLATAATPGSPSASTATAPTTSRRRPTRRRPSSPSTSRSSARPATRTPTLMQPYGIPTDQYDVYQKSVHGQALLDDRRHAGADLRLVPRLPRRQAPDLGHGRQRLRQVPHRHPGPLRAEPALRARRPGPKCWTCHGTHDVSQPDEALFFHPTPPDVRVHHLPRPDDPTAADQARRASRTTADRRCDTCHHPDSDIYAQAEGDPRRSLAAPRPPTTDAEARIAEAAALGMIVTDADVALTEAKTSLIQARAAVHTTKLTLVSSTAGDAETKADSAASMAQAKLDESVFRQERDGHRGRPDPADRGGPAPAQVGTRARRPG